MREIYSLLSDRIVVNTDDEKFSLDTPTFEEGSSPQVARLPGEPSTSHSGV